MNWDPSFYADWGRMITRAQIKFRKLFTARKRTRSCILASDQLCTPTCLRVHGCAQRFSACQLVCCLQVMCAMCAHSIIRRPLQQWVECCPEPPPLESLRGAAPPEFWSCSLCGDGGSAGFAGTAGAGVQSHPVSRSVTVPPADARRGHHPGWQRPSAVTSAGSVSSKGRSQRSHAHLNGAARHHPNRRSRFPVMRAGTSRDALLGRWKIEEIVAIRRRAA